MGARGVGSCAHSSGRDWPQEGCTSGQAREGGVADGAYCSLHVIGPFTMKAGTCEIAEVG